MADDDPLRLTTDEEIIPVEEQEHPLTTTLSLFRAVGHSIIALGGHVGRASVSVVAAAANPETYGFSSGGESEEPAIDPEEDKRRRKLVLDDNLKNFQ